MARPRDPTLRAALLQAASHVFAQQGFARAALDAIGAAARVTKGGVYFHFASKEALFAATLDLWQDQLDKALDAAESSHTRGADRLRATLHDWLRFHFAYPVVGQLRRVHAAELRGRFLTDVRRALGSPQQALRARLRRLIGEGLADGSLYAVDPALAAFALAATLEGCVLQREIAPQEVAPFCDPEALADGILGPLLVVPGPRVVEGADRYQPPF